MKKLKQQAPLKHRLILQAAMCVEDLLYAMEKNGGRPWICIVNEHMEALFPEPRKLKPKKEIVYGNEFKI